MNEIRKQVENTYKMKKEDLIWKPYYPNNMSCNPLEGYYCVIPVQKSDGSYSARKYTIRFQYKESEEGWIIADEIESYILFENSYSEIKGPLEHPEPTENSCFDLCGDCNDVTFSHCEVNTMGTFVRAFDNIEKAKERALKQFQMVYGYALSHLI